ncbi:MAG: hypothetical protein JO036_00575 [Candidatus Eremiobacteraeota bacterium]|nr:hypothetical protein [Candidatus Eremiobacteraeota bacterium]
MKTIGAVILVLALIGPRQTCAEGADPGSSATPPALPVIGTTKSRPLCTALRDSVAPAVQALMQNDALIASSKAGYRGMALSGPRQDLDLVVMANNVQAMVKNLSDARGRLDGAVVPPTPRTQDDRDVVAAKAQLHEIAAKQTEELDTINGILETIRLQRMGAIFPHSPRWVPMTRAFFADVAAAIGEQERPIAKSEGRLSPLLISIASRCGGAK